MLTKSLKFSLSFLAILILLFCCEKKEVDKSINQQISEYNQPNPDPSEFEPLPDIEFDLSTVPDYSSALKIADESSSLEPATLEATLRAGESIVEIKTGHLASAPPLGDIMLSFDLTGSMGGAINGAKANAIAIIGGVRGLIPDSQFGVMSHMDYNGSYNYCGYSSSYGSGPDYPYLLGLSLSENPVDISNAINALSLGYGNDGYENYSRVLYESYADPNIGWRPGSKKIQLLWLDNYPHDCDIDLGGGVMTTGVDPGPDALAGTLDDLDFDDVLLEMQNNNVTPIVITTDTWNLDFWQTQMQSIGGDAYLLGSDIVDQIVDIINNEFTSLDEVKLEVCDPTYASWFSSSPEFVGNVDLTSGADVEFEVTITVPPGTEPGDYAFDVCMLGDGAEYARQHVFISVVNGVPFDIKPTSCPNPLNSKSGGVLPTALLGTPDFDVTEIDPESITLEGVSPLRWSLEDVATPFEPYLDKPMDAYACNELTADGLEDLTLKFDYREIVDALDAKYGPLSKGQVLKLTIEGQTLDGLPFIGEDVMIVVK